MGAFLWISLCLAFVSSPVQRHAAPHEVDENEREGHDEGSYDEGDRERAWLEAEGLHRCDQQPHGPRRGGGEEDRRLHSPRRLPHEDPREGIPSGCAEEANLGRRSSSVASGTIPDARSPRKSRGAGMGGARPAVLVSRSRIVLYTR